jgi:hypothetical protein
VIYAENLFYEAQVTHPGARQGCFKLWQISTKRWASADDAKNVVDKERAVCRIAVGEKYWC